MKKKQTTESILKRTPMAYMRDKIRDVRSERKFLKGILGAKVNTAKYDLLILQSQLKIDKLELEIAELEKEWEEFKLQPEIHHLYRLPMYMGKTYRPNKENKDDNI